MLFDFSHTTFNIYYFLCSVHLGFGLLGAERILFSWVEGWDNSMEDNSVEEG